MTTPIDPGYGAEPLRTLCQECPGADVYSPQDFRVEWGPIFHRGRLDGTARALVIGQDPAAAEDVVRRILIGPAGQRAQGFLAKLGLRTSYVMVNTFLYSVYSQQSGDRHKNDPGIRAYRERWFDALFGDNIEAVVAFGGLAHGAWQAYAKRIGGRAQAVPYAHVRHPTWPESSSGTNTEALAKATKELLSDWNRALKRLAPEIRHPDVPTALIPYGAGWQPEDLAPIPPEDVPAGLPAWMRSLTPWAQRVGATAAQKRATLAITVPSDALPQPGPSPARAERAIAAPPPPPTLELDAAQVLAAAVHATRGPGPVRAEVSRRLALRGRVVTMNARDEVIDDGIVWLENQTIAAVQPADAPPPPAFAGIEPVDTRGTIYPGFMDLHNHLAYNILSLWNVPATYTNRDRWKGEPAYDQMVRRPLSIFGPRPEMLPAICRYAEAKQLFGGVTTTQGIRLASAAGISTYFRGFVRNVELPDDGALPRGESRMPDVAAKDVEKFFRTIETYEKRDAAYLLHLSEGTDAAARKHFLALQMPGDKWAIDDALAGIHCVALTKKDLTVLQQNGGSMVWSPMSNLLLYGKTADVAAAKSVGLKIALGCDWSPSGSKNILGEMKVAWLHSQESGEVFSPKEIVSMVTRTAAEVLHWDGKLGTVEASKIADLTVLSSRDDDVYQNALRATEQDVRLVVIGGVPRYGHADTMRELALPEKDLEHLSVAGQLRTLDLESTDPHVPTIRFTEAQALLADALGDLPRLEQEEPTHLTRFLAAAPRVAQGFTIALDETEPTGLAMRPLFGAAVRPAAAAVRPGKAAKAPLPTIPVALDAPTVADEAGLLPLIAGQRNLPTYIKKGLAFYKLSVPAAQRPLGPQATRKSIRKRKERAARPRRARGV